MSCRNIDVVLFWMTEMASAQSAIARPFESSLAILGETEHRKQIAKIQIVRTMTKAIILRTQARHWRTPEPKQTVNVSCLCV